MVNLLYLVLRILYLTSVQSIGHDDVQQLACQFWGHSSMPCLAIVNSAVPTTPVLTQTLEMPDDAKTDKACCTSAYPCESVSEIQSIKESILHSRG